MLKPIIRSKTQLTPTEKACENYEKTNFPEAISQFEDILKDTVWQDASFYLAISYLANDQAEKSIEILNQISDSETQFALERKWYLGLAFLKIGDKELAKIELNKLKASNSVWGKRAEKILGELE